MGSAVSCLLQVSFFYGGLSSRRLTPLQHKQNMQRQLAQILSFMRESDITARICYPFFAHGYSINTNAPSSSQEELPI